MKGESSGNLADREEDRIDCLYWIGHHISGVGIGADGRALWDIHLW